MCGIFGVITLPTSSLDLNNLSTLTNNLFLLSESRGKDSAGLVLVDNGEIQVFKRPERARHMIRSGQYRQLMSDFQKRILAHQQPVILMGHARMVTNGRKEYHGNNQPVIKEGFVCIHNGIIVNDETLWQQHQSLSRLYEVDTEVLLSLIQHYVQQGLDFVNAVICAVQETQGANSIALVTNDRDGIVLATTNGSLYFSLASDSKTLVFASEEYILRQAVQLPSLKSAFNENRVNQINPGDGYIFRFDDLQPHRFTLNQPKDDIEILPLRPSRKIIDLLDHDTPVYSGKMVQSFDMSSLRTNDQFVSQVNAAVANLRRCSRCILPETFPFIEFDDDGICNYCRAYHRLEYKGQEALRNLVTPYQRSDGKPDILMPLSGGRDSSYGIHYVKNVLDMNPVAYTYDWGLVTDLARRNISRMCGELGIEHILISADIKSKLNNVRKNVLAWLNKPVLGTVPLFMAGDKQFFYYSNLLKKQMNIGIVLYSMNPLERTDFKVGFCGISEIDHKQEKHYALGLSDRLKMIGFYGNQFLSNPAYFNSSLFDSFFAFIAYYMIPKDYHILYEYLPWDEQTINAVLINQYVWETATDTRSTWRIGDGTAPFYNYIYYTIAGFTENDTFRSNQIREGLITRAEGLRWAETENQPRYESMNWYCDRIGIDLGDALKVINAAPKLYGR